MNDQKLPFLPPSLDLIQEETRTLGFDMASDERTGALLRALAASKPKGNFLELGTGTGLATAWILSGMDRHSRLTTIDTDERLVRVAKRHLGNDPRLSFVIGDAAEHVTTAEKESFDLIFADAWPGKYEHLDAALDLVKAGGFYVVDDMLPQPNWPEGHGRHVERLLSELEARSDLALTKMAWSTGLVVAVKNPGGG